MDEKEHVDFIGKIFNTEFTSIFSDNIWKTTGKLTLHRSKDLKSWEGGKIIAVMYEDDFDASIVKASQSLVRQMNDAEKDETFWKPVVNSEKELE